ncbi:hypothetical protein ICN31_09370, partial [Polynucleobacter sp. UB-Piko-W3]|nr:hypothetical protein [Polynucleobacter sp. UB-Piko-W3]
MLGGIGNDIYFVDNVGDFVKESPTHVDYNNSNAPVINPAWYAADPASLGLINDPQDPNAASNLQLLGGGIDTIRTTLNSYSLNPATNGNTGVIGDIENLEFIGTGNFVGIGNDLNNTLTTGSGNDSLDGGLGDDTLIGNGGNDTYTMTFGVDSVIR